MQRLGRYEIVSEIGRGGMGIVYRALDPALGRTVAIKTIALRSQGNPQEGEQLRVRLMREAQAAATLTHPNVVAVYDVGQEEDAAYVVMEFVQGETLDKALAEPGAPRSPQALLKVLEEVAHALDYAHAHGIVHRDVKPANIFIEENGGVKLGDFGVAKVTWSRTMTETGALVGSPHYMAPEQLKGNRVTSHADQFSLAAVAYTVLVGRKPFDADTFASLASKILFAQPPAPTLFGVRLPPAAEQALNKAMSKEPANRFANCTEFVEALEDAFQVVAPAPAGIELPRRWVTPASVTAAMLLILAVGVFLWMRRQATRDESAALRKPQARPAVTTSVASPAKEKAGSVITPASANAVSAPVKAKSIPPVSPAPANAPLKELTQPAPHLLRALDRRVNPKDGLVYVQVPPGTFRMGCSTGDTNCYGDEEPVHSVTLTSGFWIGQTEVTVEAYQRSTQATGEEMPPAPGVASYWRESKMPMLNVTWNEAKTFCQWAGGELPTEAQWEYAARAGDPGPFYGKPDEIAWYSGDRGSGTSDYKPHPVGQKAPNALGLYDMLGNAWEWCKGMQDRYTAEPAVDPSTPPGPNNIRRGGGFNSALESLRVSNRTIGNGPNWRNSEMGFRCVLPLH